MIGKLLSKLKNEDISKRIYIVGIDGLGGAGKSTIVNSLKLQLKILQMGLSEVFSNDTIFHAEQLGYRKLDPEIYSLVL